MVECIDTTAFLESRREVICGAEACDFDPSLLSNSSSSQGRICQSRWQVFRPPHAPRDGT